MARWRWASDWSGSPGRWVSDRPGQAGGSGRAAKSVRISVRILRWWRPVGTAARVASAVERFAAHFTAM